MPRHARAPRPRLLAFVLCLLALAAPPALAAPRAAASPASPPPASLAATYVVDKLGDTVTRDDDCDATPSDCPLRRAVQLANGADNTIITFDPAVFTPSTPPIELTGPLEPLDRRGTQVSGTGANVKITINPTASNRDTIFLIQDDDIILERLTLYGALQANVRVYQRSDRQITLRNNLIGTPTSGSCPAGTPTQTGIDVIRNNSDSVNAASAIYIYGNRVECHDSTAGGTGGIIARDGRGVYIGSNGTQSGGDFRNILRRNRNGIGLVRMHASLIIGNTVITNTLNGVYIDDANATDQTRNTIDGNLIGTSGTTPAEGNGNNGISLFRSPYTVIKNNVVAGNNGNGISVTGGAADNNAIESNFIGVAGDRRTIIPNGRAQENASNGIFLGDGADNNTIGGTQASQLNLIGGNRGHGLMIDNSDNNLVLFNDIGYTSANNELPLPNGGAGIKLSNGSLGNTIGPAGEAAPPPLAPQSNFIWHNGGSGVEINGADGNKIYGNSLRFNEKGVRLVNAHRNEIFRARIVDNEGAGISEENGADTNFWSEISTNANGGAGGIDKLGNNPAAPRIVAGQRLSATSYRLKGTGANNAVVEVYLSTVSARDEAARFVGRGTVADGFWSIDATLPAGTAAFAFVATQTLGTAQANDRRTSELSPFFMPGVYAPLTRK